MSDPSIEKRFSAAADTYHDAAQVQARVAERLAGKLPPDPGNHRILEIGCGTGLLTQHLIKKYPDAEIHALDLSDAMISTAQKNLAHPNLQWICADYATFEPDHRYDLICSSSTLHWLTPLEATFARIQTQLEPAGSFHAALMLHDTFKELHDLRNALFPGKEVDQRLPQERDVAIALPPGYTLAVEEEHSTVTDTPAFFTMLQQLGVTGGPVSRQRLQRAELRELMDAFTAQEVTWQVGYAGFNGTAEA